MARRPRSRTPSATATRRRIALTLGGLLAILLAAGTGPVAAAGLAPTRIPDHAVYDLAGIFGPDAERTAESLARTIRSVGSADVVVVSERVGSAVTAEVALQRADELKASMGVGSTDPGGGLVLYVPVAPSACGGPVAISVSDDLTNDGLDADQASSVINDMGPLVAACDLDSALGVGMGRIATAILSAMAGASSSGRAADAGPPFPGPTDGVAVYDRAAIFRPETLAAAEKTIDAIEARTGAEIAIYTQVVEDGRTTEEADTDARALMDQWGVGRPGFDDGLVILFDMYPGLEHGQVSLYGGPGYRAAFLDNSEKQRIFDQDMLPRLKEGDFDGALRVALERVDANATPEHAAVLQRARQIDAVAGLVGAPLALMVLVGSAAWSWLRYGRDPAYLDDPSIHMAGPPAALTPAAAVFVQAAESSRRALTTTLIDLASRGTIQFRQESHLLGLQKKVGIVTEPPQPDPITLARQRRNAARRLSRPEQIVADKLDSLGRHSAGYIEPKDLIEIAPVVPAFDAALENEAIRNGWFREAPSKVTMRWRLRAGLAIGLGIAGVVAGLNIPSNGLLLIGGGLIVGGIVVWVVAGWMPAVTLPGAMIRAMLAAYRRTLKKTMDQARSMDQVVEDAGLPWLETPDQAVVWGLALGLHQEIETVIGRSISDLERGTAAAGSAYIPTWFAGPSGNSAMSAGDFAGAASGSGGLFSSSAIPDFGGMFAAIGTIGNAPSSSGGGGGGGFSGGGSGGGGGGSGGGF